jgi:catechol 2,3-dioxygenase-like lactoylglutathione lyase family enzyme
VRYQVAIDCADPDRMARFWAEALGYVLEPPPDGHESWSDYWRKAGVSEDELGEGHDSIVDPEGNGPRVWFQQVPEGKSVKNRMHFDVKVGGGRGVVIEERMRRVDEEVERLVAIGASVIARRHSPDIDHYFVAMRDPEGNEFDLV